MWKVLKNICSDCFNLDITRVGFLSCRAVGTAIAAFALAVLEGSTQPGVWYPEEVFTAVNDL